MQLPLCNMMSLLLYRDLEVDLTSILATETSIFQFTVSLSTAIIITANITVVSLTLGVLGLFLSSADYFQS